MKHVVVIVVLLAVGLVVTGCESSGGGGGGGNSLADQLVGNFIGILQNPTSGMLTSYQIVVTKVDNTTVQVAPASGSVAQTFQATLTLTTAGSVETIVLTVPSEIIETNGTYVDATGRLAYAVHLGGGDTNIEVFSGERI